MSTPSQPPEEISTGRLEMFSDGVFAIAITLLILEIKLPHVEGEASLSAALWKLWPSYGAYVLSFVVIGIFWANHHSYMRLLRRTDHMYNLLNLLFLMSVSFIPFPTAVLAEYLQKPQAGNAVTFYALCQLLATLIWLACWSYAKHNGRLLKLRLEPKYVRFLTKQYAISNALYATALAVSFISPIMSLSIIVLLALLYLLPQRQPVYQPSPKT